MNSAPDIFENCYPPEPDNTQKGGAAMWLAIAIITLLSVAIISIFCGCTAPHSVQFAPLVQFNDSPVTLPLIKGETNDVQVVQ